MADDEVIIGRDPGCDLVLTEPTVSGRHARLSIAPDSYVRLRDLNSRNGTFIVKDGGDTPVTDIELEEGQSVRFGKAATTSEQLLRHLTSRLGRNAQLRKPAPKPADNIVAVIIHPSAPPPAPTPAPPVPIPTPVPSPVPSPVRPPPVVVLCGAPGSGKTTWLARVIDSMGRDGSLTLPETDSAPSAEWPMVQQRLRMGMPAGPSPVASSEVTLSLGGAGRLVVRDAGGDLFTGTRPEAVSGDIAAVIYFIACREADMDRHMATILAMRPRLGRVPSCLVVTQCERYLPPGSGAWRGEANWWLDLPRPQWWAEAAAAFAGTMWPVASIGHGPDGGVAETLDEFGAPLILTAAPLGIERPLRHVARALRVAT